MEDFLKTVVFPGQIVEVDGKEIPTPEGVMSGKVALRTVVKKQQFWVLEIVRVERPEWEWMLGKGVHMPEDQVRELVELQG